VPLRIDESDLGASWNFVVPRSLIQPNLSLRVEVDPANEIAESVESNNRYPTSGSSADFAVVTMGPLPVRLVPVRQAVNGLQGDATNSNRESYVALAEELFPFPSVDVDVRAVYTTDAPELQANDANGAWVTILQEILALRNTSDRSSRYYYGVVATTYNAGVAGLGYVPESRAVGYNAAIGWDKANSRASVAAHEIGHNLGRKHSPCGSPTGIDPDYPYSGASIGVWGYQASAVQLKDPSSVTDIMGYCNDQWISDYTFEGILDFMGPATKVAAAPATQCLLVWGRIIDGRPVLEPAFVLETEPILPARAGPHRIELRDQSGTLSLRLDFEAVSLGDHPTGAKAFAWRLPLSPEAISVLGEIRLTVPGGVQTRRAATSAKRPARLELRRMSAETVLVEWDTQIWPMAMVRDARTGEILSFARSGASRIHTSADRLEVQLSDGVRVEKRQLAIR
jgi:hypothetical protein